MHPANGPDLVRNSFQDGDPHGQARVSLIWKTGCLRANKLDQCPSRHEEARPGEAEGNQIAADLSKPTHPSRTVCAQGSDFMIAMSSFMNNPRKERQFLVTNPRLDEENEIDFVKGD